MTIGGALVRDGDMIVADDDGVVIWPQEEYSELLARAQARLDSDNARLARLNETATHSEEGQ